MTTTSRTATVSGEPREVSTPTSHRRVAASAAGTAYERHSVRVDIPGIGHVYLPSSGEQIGYFGGLAALALLGVLDWPVAAVLGIGHVLAHNQHHTILREFGEALDEA